MEEVAEATEVIAPAVDYTNPDQVISIIVDQGPSIGMQIVGAVLIFFIGRWVAKLATNMIRKALAKTDMEDTLERFLCNIIFTWTKHTCILDTK